jgi:hypothetical protein
VGKLIDNIFTYLKFRHLKTVYPILSTVSGKIASNKLLLLKTPSLKGFPIAVICPKSIMCCIYEHPLKARDKVDSCSVLGYIVFKLGIFIVEK